MGYHNPEPAAMATPKATWAMAMGGDPNDCMLLYLLQRSSSVWDMLWFFRKKTYSMMPPDSRLLYVVVGEGEQLTPKAARVARLLYKPCAMYIQPPSPEADSSATPPFVGVDDRSSLVHHNAPGVLFVSMAPAGLLAEYATDPSAFCWKYAHTRLVCYGGGNFCRVMSSGGGERLLVMMHAFKTVYIYESSHAMGADMAINDAATIDRIRAVPDMAPLMDQWSACNMERVRACCVKIDPSFPEALPPDHPEAAAYARHRKAYEQLETTAGRQIVLAGMALALTSPDDYAPVQVRLGSNGGTKVLADPTSKIHMVLPLGYPEVMRRLDAALA